MVNVLKFRTASLHHCAWSLITSVPLWGPLGGPLCRWHYYQRWIAREMCQKALDLERSKGKERNESKCRKDEDHDLQYWPGSPAEFRQVSMCHLSHWSGQQQHLLQQLQALGAQEMQWAQALDKGPWLQMYMVPGNCTPLRQQTTEGSPSWTWQAWGCSFLLLPMRHALSSRWLWTSNHNTCKNRLKKFKELLPALSSRHLSQDTWLCVQLLCAECNAPCQWDLAIDKTKPPTSAVEWRQWSDRSAMSGRKTLSPPGPMNYLHGLALRGLDLILKERRLCWYWHVERSNGAIKTAFHILVGKRGLGRPKMTWDCREWKLSAINPHDRNMWRSGVRFAMRAASQLSGRGPTDVDVAPVPAR